jgi:hypothetical protein
MISWFDQNHSADTMAKGERYFYDAVAAETPPDVA